MTRLSLILPTYNEAENIIPVVEELTRVLNSREDEIIVVDDMSPDGTADRLEAYLLSCDIAPHVRIIRRKDKERGLSLAVVDGFAAANGQFLGVMDADLSHDSKIIPALISAVAEGKDFAVGSRRVDGGGAVCWPFLRRRASNLATALSKLLTGVPLEDPMSGFFVMRRDVYENCKETIHPRGYKILLELFVCSPAHEFIELPYIFKDRKQGYSKMSVPVLVAFLKQCVSLWWSRQRQSTSQLPS